MDFQFLKKLWCWVGGGDKKKMWFYYFADYTNVLYADRDTNSLERVVSAELGNGQSPIG